MNAAPEPAAATPPASRAQRMWAGVLRHAGSGLLAATVGMAVLAWNTWHLRCESFGCTFVGVVWVALAGLWAVGCGLWAVALMMALAFGAAQRRRGMGTRASAWALGLLLALGAGHLLYWLLR